MFVHETRRESHAEEVKALLERGSSQRAIARRLGLPRSTVQYWCTHEARPRSIARPSGPDGIRRYAYLLGVYLGDGHVVEAATGSSRLDIALDATYPKIVDEVCLAIVSAFPNALVRKSSRPGLIRVSAASVDWPSAFPQHGAGRKHLRKIELADWQSDITRAHPRELLRGLIHSDGCRCINRFRTELPSGRIAEYAYPRYFFTNLSADIRGIFCEHCDLLGIRWTQSNHRNISVSHRRSVALLDEFVGPKA
jgi:hypothetical protein